MGNEGINETSTNYLHHLFTIRSHFHDDRGLQAKMKAEHLSDAAIAAFAHSFSELVSGSSGTIPESSIHPASSLPDLEENIRSSVNRDPSLLQKTVVLKLNGGLGTSMGLDKAKSLLEVKGGNTFLDLTAKQIITMRKDFKSPVKFMLMNSFNTSKDTLNFLSKYPSVVEDPKIELMQNKVPKIDKVIFHILLLPK
jgi:UDP-N-acetylglucosamine pyrophosphorylase